VGKFQSLGRDSVGLDDDPAEFLKAMSSVSIPRSGFCWFGLMQTGALQPWKMLVSIPRSGFCWFGLETLVELDPLERVSIPRSGFCWFGLDLRGSGAVYDEGFNPSVGILLVWTYTPKTQIVKPQRFQSLGRDSVGLDQY